MHHRPQRWSQLLVLLFAVSSLGADRRAVKNDFSGYPSGAQQCLYDASDNSGCDGDTVPEMNNCLCGNGGDFVTNSAKCVADQDADDMESTYNTMSLHCSDSNTPLSISKHEWMAEGSSVSSLTSSTNTPSTTSTKTASTSADRTIVSPTAGPPRSTSTPKSDDRHGLSTGARLAFIVASAAAGVVLLVVALYVLCRYRWRRNHVYEEVHPMGGQLPPSSGNEEAVIFGTAGSDTAHPNRKPIAPSDLENSSDPRRSWYSSPDGSQVPWSPGAFEAVKLNTEFGNLHQPPPPDVYEMSNDSERLVSVSSSVTPVEMPIISVTSPTVSPASRYSRYSQADWSSQMHEDPRPYDPYRPSR